MPAMGGWAQRDSRQALDGRTPGESPGGTADQSWVWDRKGVGRGPDFDEFDQPHETHAIAGDPGGGLPSVAFLRVEHLPISSPDSCLLGKICRGGLVRDSN